ncbi:MAG: prepilin-type N-terminal cleavage/methylation domain-containing protein [Planctomycetota bacterium]
MNAIPSGTRRNNPNAPCGRPGFTLVEILIVVVILGVLAAIVIPQFTNASDNAQRSAFVTTLKQFVRSAELYRQENGGFLEDAATGAIPTGFDAYVDPDKWAQGPTIGGQWDAEFEDAGGITSGIGVVFDGTGATRDDAYMAEIDAVIDDGDVTTGKFRRIASGRYYAIIEE